MKKILIAVLLIVAILAPAAMAEGLYEGEHVTLQMMIWGGSDTYVKCNEKLFEQFPEIAEKCDIEVLIGGSGDAEVAQKLRLLLASGERMPDMVRLNYTQFAEFAQQGLLYDLTEAVAPYADNIMDAAYKITTIGGTREEPVLAMVREIKPKIWYYRKDIFDAAGVDPHEVHTVDEYIEAAAKVHEAFPNQWIENYATPINNYDLTMLLSGNGGRFCDEEGNYNIASDENVAKAFEIIKKFNNSDAFAQIVEWGADWQASFTDETLVGQMIGSWMKGHLIDWCPDQAGKWDCAMWPDEIRAGSESGGGVWVIMKDCEYPELAADILAKLSYDEEYQHFMYDAFAYIPALKSAYTDEYYGSHPYFGENLVPVTLEAMEYFDVYDYTPTFSAEMPIVMQYLNEYCAGNMELEEALQAAQDDLQNQIGNAYDAF